MGVNIIRRDSVEELRRRKSRAELQEENERLAAQVEELADALIELAGIVAGEGA